MIGRTLVFISVVVFLLGTIAVFVNGMDKFGVREMYAETADYLSKNKTGFEQIFTGGFRQARECVEVEEKCKKRNRDFIYSNLQSTEDLDDFSATYFIKLRNDNEIEKLFLSGAYRVDKDDSKKKLKVVKMLRGQVNDLHLKGIKRDYPYYTNLTYLEDFYSEIEVFVPVKRNGEIIGAIVRLYGD